MYPNGANQYRPMVNQQSPQNQQSAFPNGQQLFVPVNSMQPQYRLVAQVSTTFIWFFFYTKKNWIKNKYKVHF